MYAAWCSYDVKLHTINQSQLKILNVFPSRDVYLPMPWENKLHYKYTSETPAGQLDARLSSG